MGVITNGSGGGGGNVRYNPANDMVEIKYNGTWTPWKSGNLQTYYLYKDGEQVVEWDNTSAYSFRQGDGFTYGGGATLDTTFFYLSGYSTSYNNYYRMIGTNNAIDMTNYSKVCVEYKGTTYTYNLSSAKSYFGTSLYLGILYLRSGSYLQLYLSCQNSKAFVGNNIDMMEYVSVSTAQSSGNITKIWLE